MRKYRVDIIDSAMSIDRINYAIDRIDAAYGLIEDGFGRKGYDDPTLAEKILRVLDETYAKLVDERKKRIPELIDQLIEVLIQGAKREAYDLDDFIHRENQYSFSVNTGTTVADFLDKPAQTIQDLQDIYANATVNPDTAKVIIKYDKPAQEMNWKGTWNELIENSFKLFNLFSELPDQEKQSLMI